MFETQQGLPNSCSVCGAPVEEYWYAATADAARSGAGVCPSCASRLHPTGANPQPDAPQNAGQGQAPAADDLTAIKGIGKVNAALLNEAGITTYQALFDAEASHIAGIINTTARRALGLIMAAGRMAS